MAICSGVFFSSARFPELFQPLIKALPLTALIDSVRQVMNDGAGATVIARQATVLLVWGAVSFGAALRLFRWQ
jgi:ABC-type multidrug transport system permease subunit